MTTMASGLDRIDLVTPERYGERGYPWDDWKLLRREAPVYWYDRPGVTPFWAVTKYDDIQQISRDPETFISSQRLVIRSAGSGDGGANDPALTVPNLINMDPPEHGKYRNATSRRFSPRGMQLLEDRIDEIAEDVIDDAAAHLVSQLTDRQGMDFVRDVSARMPLAAICELLAVDRESWEDLFRWTNEFLGSEDPEYQQGRTRRETWQSGMRGLQGYFIGSHRAQAPRAGRERDDHAGAGRDRRRADAEHEILSYAILLILAGNETTRNATSGGMQALIEHPEQFALLRDQPGLLDSAVEEMLRWTSPVVHFARTVTQDTEIRGVPINAGETLAMWYPSANRDEDVFDNPDLIRHHEVAQRPPGLRRLRRALLPRREPGKAGDAFDLPPPDPASRRLPGQRRSRAPLLRPDRRNQAPAGVVLGSHDIESTLTLHRHTRACRGYLDVCRLASSKRRDCRDGARQ